MKLARFAIAQALVLSVSSFALYASFAFLAFFVLMTAGCNYRELKQAGGEANRAQSLSNFSALSSNIFQPKCIHCHNSGNTSGGVDFSTYSSTLSKSGVVVLGSPQKSSLYTEVQAAICQTAALFYQPTK